MFKTDEQGNVSIIFLIIPVVLIITAVSFILLLSSHRLTGLPSPSPTSTARPALIPASSPSPAFVSTPAPTSSPIVKFNGNAVYDLGVLVIKYFPLTQSKQNIDINATGDVGDSYAVIRQKTIDVTNNLLSDLQKASRYLGYKNPESQVSLGYHVVDTKEYNVAVPIKPRSESIRYPDYNGIMAANNICDYVDNKGVREVWLWAYQGPNRGDGQPSLGISESKMSGPNGDISNSPRYNDMPLCSYTYRVYTFNYGRGTSEAMESWGHQMEAELSAIDSNLFRNIFQGPNHPHTLNANGRCGSVHNPPNAKSEYDRGNPVPNKSDCLDWNPDGLGALSDISCSNWGCADLNDANNSSLNYMIWNWQNIPGANNNKMYQGKQLRNWWDIHGDFDNVLKSSRRLTL